jgi:anaerobic C4-dicarboxylate transporter DcuA
MTTSIVLQFVVVLAAIWMGARYSGVGLGLWGAVGLLVLVAAFGVNPTSPPIDVMLIILAVIMAASVMDAAGGIDFLVRIAERIIRANPKYVTIVAPLTTWSFTFLAGTGHIVYPLLPVIYETAHQNGIRPERPMAVATIASQQAITASPVAVGSLQSNDCGGVFGFCVSFHVLSFFCPADVDSRRSSRTLVATRNPSPSG